MAASHDNSSNSSNFSNFSNSKNDMEFKIKAYTKKELALRYFPDSMPRTAVNHLMAWIRRCPSLWQELAATGYEPTCKAFTPRQVKIITEMLGEP